VNGQIKNENINKEIINRLRLFIFKLDLFKISVHFQTTLAAETHPAEGSDCRSN
jgi:hypothetical protein